MYNEGVQKYIPIHKVRRNKQKWYNAIICAEVKRVKDIANGSAKGA